MATSADTLSNTPPQKMEVDTELSLSKEGDEQQSFNSVTSTNEVNPEADENTPAPLFYKPPTRQFVLIILALSLNVFLASLDQIIVSTSIPAITREFQTLGDISWLGTAYMMTATATQPLYGKFSDIFGRKTTMLFANVMFLIGSAICGWANSMTVLIVGRGIAGIGAGGLMAMVFIIMSDMLDMRERGKYIGFVGVVYSLASVIGPVLGGAFSDNLTWRWSFWINLPVGAVSIIFIAIFLNLPTPKGSLSDKIKRIDILGSVILMGSVIMILLPLSWGGSKHPWDSAMIIGLLVGGILATIAFVLVEWKVPKEPTVPIHLFKIRNLWATYSSLFFSGMAFFGILFYLPIYFQVVKDESATIGGFETIPMVMGITITATSSGIWVLKRGTYAFFPPVGNFLFTVAAGLCVLFTQDTKRVVTVFVLLLCGVGVGCTVQTSTLAVQAAAKPKYMATVTVLVQFIRILGQVFGIAIVGTIFNNKLESSLRAKFPSDQHILKVAQDYTLIANYGELERKWIYDSFVVALHNSFYCSVACSALAFVLSCFVQHKELKTNETHEKYQQEAKKAEQKEEIV
ncbi:hypothetical protein BG005_010740 [Podila minutissima]|nr:hypothetical protein BG005_010740 [Podila minutissima]